VKNTVTENISEQYVGLGPAVPCEQSSINSRPTAVADFISGWIYFRW